MSCKSSGRRAGCRCTTCVTATQPSAKQLAQDLIDADARRPINIAVDPPFRAMIIQIDDDRLILGMNYHHIVADFWAEAQLFAELSAIYANPRHGASGPGRDITMSELARAQVARPAGPHNKQSLAYWDRTLTGMPARLELPTDRSQTTSPSFRGARRQSAVGE